MLYYLLLSSIILLSVLYPALTEARAILTHGNRDNSRHSNTALLSGDVLKNQKAFNFLYRTPERQAETSTAVTKRAIGAPFFYRDGGLSVKCGVVFSLSDILAGLTKAAIPLLPSIPGFDYANLIFPDWTQLTEAAAEVLVEHHWQQCLECRCDDDGIMLPATPNPNQRSCLDILDVYRCAFVYELDGRSGCACNAQLITHTRPRYSQSVKAHQDAIDQIPEIVRNAHPGWKYTLGKTPKNPSMALRWDTDPEVITEGIKAPPSPLTKLGVKALLKFRNYAYDKALGGIAPVGEFEGPRLYPANFPGKRSLTASNVEDLEEAPVPVPDAHADTRGVSATSE
ncbi:hypothetical protein TWF696_005930 [Orbilia brochopaga]|uniref:Uncharacterized protein n=1 Tax=Orbilia brochopaga TaxID=3140254 RepID=A0AAV9UUL9_9PEZI